VPDVTPEVIATLEEQLARYTASTEASEIADRELELATEAPKPPPKTSSPTQTSRTESPFPSSQLK
jgi:hypothetical protein